ncbi:hypothetical protein JTE90_023822 [Oedothorax gibbosus]|uniref:DUF7041 domain-containing protein n=1 Tax=Oedothorax gibbosus TaxID=931172 RepID=A0AAV6VIB1_9ARAC|nr:hypothetical protein JTE90_023822 [Oedothorax gibbosus]
MQNDTNNEVPAAAITHVAVKAPPFWRGNPEIWFRQMESQFVLAGITVELTKFHYVVSALQPEELAIVGDLVMNIPVENPYTSIRDRLCNQYADTKEEQLRDLISGMQLGDKKPSRLLLEMKGKAGTMAEDLLKTLFMQRLPSHVQQILAISNDKLEKLAEIADGIMSLAGGVAVHEIKSPVSQVPQQAGSLEEPSLRTMLMEITARLDHLETRSRSRSRDSWSGNNRQRSSSRRRAPSGQCSSHCWYHQRFGEKASNCKPPCTWKQEN